MRNSTLNLVDGLKALKHLDLSKIKKKLMEPKPEGQGWSQAQVNEAEKWYRRFLELGVRYPDAPIVPNFPIDTFWHQHILDTRAYAADCDAIFGELLHHYPYFGLNGPEDAANRDAAFVETNRLYELHFGEDCTHMAGFAGPAIPEDCMVSLHGNDGSKADVAMGCGHGGSGTGCGQGCSRKVPERREPALVGSNCNSGGSGTGCGQGCSRGG